MNKDQFKKLESDLWRAADMRANKELASTRDALLPRLISGKLSVDALDIRFPPGMAEVGA